MSAEPTPPATPPPPDRPSDWRDYFDAVAGLPARQTLLLALERFETEPALPLGQVRFAVDLGCGEGRDAAELLRRGWRVLAIDSHPDGIDRLRARIPASIAPMLTTRVATFEGADWPECHLANASFAIPHCDPAGFPRLWERITAGILPGGRFAGQLFGVNDQWAAARDGIPRTFHTRAEVESLLAPFDIEHLEEVERMGKDAFGEPKYWHVFHIVGRKR